MPRLTEATAIKRRMHILQAAVKCLFEKGFAATSVDDVCAEAGISKGAFYSHYESKEQLIHAVANMLASELAPIDTTSVDSLAHSIFDKQIAPALSPQNSRFGLEMMAATRFDAVLSNRMTTDLENVRAATEAAVDSLMARGLARDCNARAVASIVQAHILGSLARNAVAPSDKDELRAEVLILIRSLIAPL